MAETPSSSGSPPAPRRPARARSCASTCAGAASSCAARATRLYAIEDRCPHAGVALASGRLEGFVLECPLHGGRLDVRDGSPVEAPIRRAAERFAVREGVRGELEVLVPQSA